MDEAATNLHRVMLKRGERRKAKGEREAGRAGLALPRHHPLTPSFARRGEPFASPSLRWFRGGQSGIEIPFWATKPACAGYNPSEGRTCEGRFCSPDRGFNPCCLPLSLQRRGEQEGARIATSLQSRVLAGVLIGVLGGYGLVGCGSKSRVTPGAPPAKSGISAPANAEAFVTPRFEDATRGAGLDWVHNPCRTGKKLLPETVGGGGGFLDYDRDGRLDILLLNGAPLPGYRGPTPRLALYRNRGDGTFTEVTKQAGLDITLYGMGAAVGDYDNDGWPDLYITALGQNRLFHNQRGKFVDVTQRAGVAASGFSTAAAWVDYDGDRRLDLFVARYVEWTPETDLPCGPENARQYCPPHQYQGAPPVLYRNRGDGVFEDVSARAGVLGHPSKTLAVTPCDVNGDGLPDLHLANDTEPDVLLVNNGKGVFTDNALMAGLALGVDGNATGSMGVDIAMPFNDGRLCIAVGTFAGQELSLFVAEQPPSPDNLLFANRKREAGVDAPTRPMTTFGLVFADADLDGWPDLMVLNGHIDDDQSISVGGQSIPYRQPAQLFQNRRDGTFRDVAAQAGVNASLVGRGLAVGDYDNDGKPDFLVFENGGPVRLWHNVTNTTGGWVGIELVGAKSPRDGTGAVVTVKGPGWTQSGFATSARSYLAVNDPRLHIGVGDRKVDEITVRWPQGTVTTLKSPLLQRYLKIEEK
jgi:enediyne biosynthesis protein E4